MKRIPESYLKLTITLFIVMIISWFILPFFATLLTIFGLHSTYGIFLLKIAGIVNMLSLPIGIIFLASLLASFFGYLVSVKKSPDPISESRARSVKTSSLIFWGLSSLVLLFLIRFFLFFGAVGGGIFAFFLVLFAVLSIGISLYSLVTIRLLYKSGDYRKMTKRSLLPFSAYIPLIVLIFSLTIPIVWNDFKTKQHYDSSNILIKNIEVDESYPVQHDQPSKDDEQEEAPKTIDTSGLTDQEMDVSKEIATIRSTLESLPSIVSACAGSGGVISDGGISGYYNCIGGSLRLRWPQIGVCGSDPEDTRFIVFNNNTDDWNITLECANFDKCDGPKNAICDKNGCRYGGTCQ